MTANASTEAAQILEIEVGVVVEDVVVTGAVPVVVT